jgi:hypothetical protein
MSGDTRIGHVNGPVNTGNPVNQGGNQVVGSGSIRISGGNSQSSTVVDPAVLDALARLRAQLVELRLTGPERSAADVDLINLERAGENKREAAGAFESFLRRLKDAGALAQVGAEFSDAASRVIRWLGPLAAGAIALLKT